MASPLDSGKIIAEAALVAITASACVIPDAWPIAGEAYKMQCDPGAMYEAGQAWLDSAGKLGEALNAAMTINNSIGGSGWEGKDHDAFAEKVADYIRQMMVARIYAYTVGIAVIIAAVETFIALLVLAAIAVGLTIFAAAILATAASVVGFLGAVEALEADASIFAVDCEIALRELGAATNVTDGVLAAGIGAVLAGDVGVQVAMGNTGALGDLTQATVDGIGTITAGLTARLFRDAIAKGASGTVGRGPLNDVAAALGVGFTFGGSPIDDWTQPVDKVEH